jgi:hypothetical protein
LRNYYNIAVNIFQINSSLHFHHQNTKKIHFLTSTKKYLRRYPLSSIPTKTINPFGFRQRFSIYGYGGRNSLNYYFHCWVLKF